MKEAVFIIVFLSMLSGSANGQTTSNTVTEDDLRTHVKFLASDELEGRASGSRGNEKAAQYIADQFKEYGLRPRGDNGSYLQTFEFVSSVRLGEKNRLAFSRSGEKAFHLELKKDQDFRPVGFSSTTSATAPLVFAGYGISAPNQEYDDYDGIDVAGKVVIVLRYSPEGSSPHSEYSRHSALREKSRVARDKGAFGIIIVTGPMDEEEDDIMKLTYDNSFSSSGIAVVSMKRFVLDKLIESQAKTVKTIQESINSTKKPMSFPISGVEVQLETDLSKVMASTSNVVGLIEGENHGATGETIVLGAHMDHLGYGGNGSGALDPDVNGIHNGADDNASGTAALLELAQAFAPHQGKLKRSLLFVAFTGEELGTLGSAHYVNHPAIPLTSTIAMLNMDMVGRLENRTLTVQGMGTSSQWTELIRTHNSQENADSFNVKFVQDGVGPSDHSQFYLKDIPVLFFFTGTHNDYHKISDDWEKLNYVGEKQLVDFIYSITLDLDQRQDRPVFTKTQTVTSMGGGDGRGFTVTLGIIPDYGETGEGMKIGGIRPDGPAEKAGLKPGDLIVKMAGRPVLNIYDYMGILGDLKAGEHVDVEVKRDGKQMTLSAIMMKR